MAWNKDEQISFIEGRTKVSLAVSRQDLLVPVGWALEVIFQLESLCFLSKIWEAAQKSTKKAKSQERLEKLSLQSLPWKKERFLKLLSVKASILHRHTNAIHWNPAMDGRMVVLGSKVNCDVKNVDMTLARLVSSSTFETRSLASRAWMIGWRMSVNKRTITRAKKLETRNR